MNIGLLSKRGKKRATHGDEFDPCILKAYMEMSK
jgi:hypothetical protein